jgi:hypothetical protein
MGITWTAKSRPSKVSPEIHHADGTQRRTCSCFLSIPIEPKCNQHISTTFSTLRPQEKICGVYVIIHFDPGASSWALGSWFPCFQASSSSPEPRPARVFLWKMLLAVLGGSTAQVRSSWMDNGELFMAAPNNGEVPRVFLNVLGQRRGLGSLEFF